jgi:uncharacterized protein (DUF305 family)
MKNPTLLYGIIGLLMGSLLTLVVVTFVSPGDNYGIMRMMGMSQRAGDADCKGSLDQHFIEHMIPHHEGAIEMAVLAQEKSSDPEILDLADAIISSQTEEIEQMEDWYKEWYGIEFPVIENARMGMGRGMMHGGMMGGDTADIEALENAEDFDTAFLEEMIPHHQMAVMMAQMLLSGTSRPEMQQLAEEIIVAQEDEIEQMRMWLSE